MKSKRLRNNSDEDDELMIQSQRLYDTSRWAMFPLDLLAIMPLEEAALITYLINFGRLKARDGEVKKGWFRCSTQHLTSTLNVSRRSHDRLMHNLEVKGLVERTMYGNPARRWVKIDFMKIEELLKEERMLRPESGFDLI
jgi:hypothetical protein